MHYYRHFLFFLHNHGFWITSATILLNRTPAFPGEIPRFQNPEHGRQLRCTLPHPFGGIGSHSLPVLVVRTWALPWSDIPYGQAKDRSSDFCFWEGKNRQLGPVPPKLVNRSISLSQSWIVSLLDRLTNANVVPGGTYRCESTFWNIRSLRQHLPYTKRFQENLGCFVESFLTNSSVQKLCL